ncbi:hypothetical protein [Aerococcus kribbianus]|uniref:Uncharacterized protein n=1 Tax=Aerococcus kribbianus TaxID=2999064 RepID=A0A9X3JGF9_9LACT|nr:MULTISPECIES: hypothetical protein [unclassified Aerococcus]MCZ0717201.1 hypothetical protein [Aerococcus sp. YH-aer221]MCZ0725489.1 hypothetical protein [Aerococcus sp. YH-aer222]
MTQTVYTNYWISKRDGVRKEHGTYASEEDALEAIKVWWELKGESYKTDIYRTNTGALEIAYIDDNYFYRIESHETDQPLPKKTYRLKKPGEVESQRAQLNLDDHSYLFDELGEPYRDRLIRAMGDIQLARSFTYNEEGVPIERFKD